MAPVHPYRGTYGAPRPPRLAALPLPPRRLPPRVGLRPLKRWRYVAVFAPEVMVCAATVRIGPGRQTFWAVWDRRRGRLVERTSPRPGGVLLRPGSMQIRDVRVRLDLRLVEEPGIEVVCPHGAAWVWTRKQAGIRADGVVEVDGVVRRLADARAVVDDTAGYHARHTSWRWTAGAGAATDGRQVAWNLVEGINAPPEGSERTLWLDGHPHETAPVRFDPALRRVVSEDGGDLRFVAEAERARKDNLLLVRSFYTAPFGTFAGTLPGGVELAEGLGVMERHQAVW